MLTIFLTQGLSVDIFYKTKKLQKICSDQKTMDTKLGIPVAKKLRQRHMELKAADNLKQISHLPPSRCHELTNNRSGQFSVDLVNPFRLLFIPANDPLPRKEDGGIDLQQVTEIEIIKIEDTH